MPDLTEHVNIASSSESPKSAITFLNLPPEILRMVAALLDKEQLPSFRLISKQIWYHCSDIFAKVHFAHLHHHLMKPSLEDLILITRNPMFSTCIKSIQFSTARNGIQSQESQSLLDEQNSEFCWAGHHITMLTTALVNLQSHGNHKVSLGVFDSLCEDTTDLLRAFNNVSPRLIILGHGYVKAYGVENVPAAADPKGTMLAVSEAAILSGYSLNRLSLTTADHSSSQTVLIKEDHACVLHVKGASCFKSDLTLKHVVKDVVRTKSHLPVKVHCLSVEVQTGTVSHLSLQGQASEIDDRKLYRAALRLGDLLRQLPPVFIKTEYRKLTLKDMLLIHQGLRILCLRTMKQNFECLEIRNVNVWIGRDVNDLRASAFTFLNHFKKSFDIRHLKISNLIVHGGFRISHQYPQPLTLASEEIIAEGYDQVQGAFDDLIAQTLAWQKSLEELVRSPDK
ncbi:hypothetical protein KCU81_g1514, partial [Aureobasidium melanogenum]|uniref:F-box domain-containing protein n=1 Tax=Aureobasidium melanogenum (strain CBS 110374) TaxID=1043003 RepID=A0A074W8K4_AURM1